MTVDAVGHVYIGDDYRCRIVKADPDGMLLASWTACGDEAEPLDFPSAVAVGPDGRILVAHLRGVRVFGYEATR